MKAGIITAVGKAPFYGDFDEPIASEGKELITVTACALSQFSNSRSSGSHYSSEGMLPSVAGADGVGCTADGRRVYFVLPEAPYGALAQKSLVRSKQCVAVPDSRDDVSVAAIGNPGMSAWAAQQIALACSREKSSWSMAQQERRAGWLFNLQNISAQAKSSAQAAMKASLRNCCLWERTS